MRNLRYLKKRCKRAALSLGPLLGKMEGFVYWDFREKRKMHILVPFPWAQRTLKFKSGGLWKFSKG